MINGPVTLFGGYMISLQGIWHRCPQNFMAIFQYISPVRWGFSALMSSVFPVYHEDGSIVRGTDVLYSFGFEDTRLWVCIVMLTAIFVGSRGLVVVTLQCQDRSKSKGMVDNRNRSIPVRRTSTRQNEALQLVSALVD